MHKKKVILARYLLLLFLISFTVAQPSSECRDGLDNDGDGYCDYLWKNAECIDGSIPGDTDCDSKGDKTEVYECSAKTEVCDGVDNDCDGSIDEGDVCATSYYCDTDNDGYIGSDVDGTCTTQGCVPQSCSESPGNDCNDNNAQVWTTVTAFTDTDNDGYGAFSSSLLCIGVTLPSGFAYVEGDCNDAQAAVNPGATEVCSDTIDNNCNSLTDCEENVCSTESSCQAQSCSDGTQTNTCSTTQPYYCSEGTLTEKCSVCGCGDGLTCNTTTNTCYVEVSCLDSDSGKNFYVSGTLTYDDITYTDSCNGNVVREYYCTNNQPYYADYSCPNGCSNGVCLSGTNTNTKNMNLYEDKEVFLITSTNWKEVLPLVPLTTWTGTENCKKGYLTQDDICTYPTLVYQTENTQYEAIAYLLQQYNPSKVTIVGESNTAMDNYLVSSEWAGINEQAIQRINPSDYFSYWQNFDTVIYVQNDYELALLASTYASLHNAPLVIQGTSADNEGVFSGRNVICVGNVQPSGASCVEQFSTLRQLQYKYLQETQTDKILMVSPGDYDIFELDGTGLKSVPRPSLVAPILASAKHELLYPFEWKTYLTTELKEKLHYDSVDFFGSAENAQEKFITLFVNPTAIIPRTTSAYTEFTSLVFTSNHNPDTGTYYDLYPGQIRGLRTSDISAYVARALHYHEFNRNMNGVFMGSPVSKYTDTIKSGKAAERAFSQAGYNTQSSFSRTEYTSFSPDMWINQDVVIYYGDHGSAGWAGIPYYDMPKDMNGPITLQNACVTCQLFSLGSFCDNAMFKGAIANMGSVGQEAVPFAGGSNSDSPLKFLNGIYYRQETFGEAYSKTKQISKSPVLLGDPTLKVGPPYFTSEASWK